MSKPSNNNRASAEDDLIKAILQVKPTADMPKPPTGKAKAKPKKKSGK